MICPGEAACGEPVEALSWTDCKALGMGCAASPGGGDVAREPTCDSTREALTELMSERCAISMAEGNSNDTMVSVWMAGEATAVKIEGVRECARECGRDGGRECVLDCDRECVGIAWARLDNVLTSRDVACAGGRG